MNKDRALEFLDHIERLAKDQAGYVIDSRGQYETRLVLNGFLHEARELMKYGEPIVALENLLENLNEVSILLNRDAIDLARQALGISLTSGSDQLLVRLTK